MTDQTCLLNDHDREIIEFIQWLKANHSLTLSMADDHEKQLKYLLDIFRSRRPKKD